MRSNIKMISSLTAIEYNINEREYDLGGSQGVYK